MADLYRHGSRQVTTGSIDADRAQTRNEPHFLSGLTITKLNPLDLELVRSIGTVCLETGGVQCSTAEVSLTISLGAAAKISSSNSGNSLICGVVSSDQIIQLRQHALIEHSQHLGIQETSCGGCNDFWANTTELQCDVPGEKHTSPD